MSDQGPTEEGQGAHESRAPHAWSLQAVRWPLLGVALALLVGHLVGRSRLNAHLGLPLVGWDTFLVAEACLLVGLKQAWSLFAPWSDDDGPERRALWPYLALVGLVFLMGFRLHEATIYPTAHDQLSLIDHLYTIVYRLGVDGWLALLDLPTLKGACLELVGFVCLLVLGISRSAIAVANILFFVGLVLAVQRYFEAHGGRLVARAAVGVLLLGNSAHLATGGVRDLRWDAAGLCTYGAFTLALAHLLERPGRRALQIAVTATVATILTRSISAVYVAATLTGCFAWDLGAGFAAGWDPDRRARLRHMVGVGLGAGAAGLGLALLKGRELMGYYGQHALAKEGQVRLNEFGLETRWDLPAYYSRSLLEHAWVVLILLVLLALTWAAGRLSSGRSGAPSTGSSCGIPLRVGALAFLGAFGPLLGTAPSPVVVGVVTGALVLLTGTLFDRATTRGGPIAPLRVSLANLLLICGAISLVTRGLLPSDQIHWRERLQQDARVGLAADELVRALPGTGRPKVLWMSFDEAVNEGVFRVRLHEAGRSRDARRIRHGSMSLVERRGPEYFAECVREADAVVAPAGWGSRESPFPGVATVRSAVSVWRPVLERSFVPIARVPGIALEFDVSAYDYWVRAVSLGEVTGAVAPRESDPGHLWAGALPLSIQVLNRAAEARAAELRGLMAPPSGVSAARFAVRSRSGTQRFDLSNERGWELSAPIEAPPGTCEVVITLEHQEPPGEARGWWTLEDLRLR